MLSLPQASMNGEIPEIFVGKDLDNAVLYYIKYPNLRGQCYVDVDTKVDSNTDGVSDNDNNFLCNQLFLYRYEPKYESTLARIYYSDASQKTVSKDFKVSFLDFEVKLDPALQQTYTDINTLLKTME